TLCLAVLLGLSFQPLRQATASESWMSYLYMNDIRGLAATEEGIWCATGGGVLFYDFALSGFRTWNRTATGLGSDSLSCAAVFEGSQIAFGTEQVGVCIYEPDRGLWYNYNSMTWQIASDQVLFMREEMPWRLIGSQGGFVALRDGDVRWACQQGLDICGLPGWDVSAGIYYDGALWFGTLPGESAVGGVGRLDDSTGVWDILSTNLPSLDVADFAVWGDSLFCATSNGICVWTDVGWDAREDGLPSGFSILDLHAGSTRLLAAGSGGNGGVFAWEPAAGEWMRLGSQILQARCITEGSDGIIWAGTSAARSGAHYLLPEEDGLWEFVGEVWIQHRHAGPHPVQNYRTLHCDQDGRLWGATASPAWRIVLLDSGRWSFFDSSNSPLTDTWVFDIRVEGDQVWVGHCCCNMIEKPCNMNIWSLGDTTITLMEPVYNIWDSAKDSQGNLWFASYYEHPEENPELAKGFFHWNAATGAWTQYSKETTGGLLLSDAVAAITVDWPYLWIGHIADGATRVNLGSDGLPLLYGFAWTQYSSDTDEPLAGNRVTSMASRPGEVWIGTDNGLSLHDAEGWWIFRQRPGGLPGNEIKDIALTDDGAAWIAVRGEGVTRMSRSPSGGFAFERFGPPDLVSPNVQVMTAGSEGRDLWVGTSAGLSHYIPRAALADEQFSEVYVYPNPYNPHCGESVRFVNLPGSAERGVVVDVSGRVIHRFERKWPDDGFWDGRDTDGDLVAPGLYIVRVATPQGWLSGQIAVLDLPCD
ncbi:MAG: hypothetical protein KAY24_18715, partial [Candidatus Eisenbacteria sp.]|nr:hypothetical protein [Candidatus Eisenbacteria bacterium]